MKGKIRIPSRGQNKVSDWRNEDRGARRRGDKEIGDGERQTERNGKRWGERRNLRERSLEA